MGTPPTGPRHLQRAEAAELQGQAEGRPSSAPSAAAADLQGPRHCSGGASPLPSKFQEAPSLRDWLDGPQAAARQSQRPLACRSTSPPLLACRSASSDVGGSTSPRAPPSPALVQRALVLLAMPLDEVGGGRGGGGVR